MTSSANFVRLPCLLAILLILGGCSIFGSDDEERDVNRTEEQIYEMAQGNLRTGNMQLAIERLQMLEARFPFGPYAEQAQLEIIYAYYQGYQAEEARAAATRFIRLHPQHPSVDYAHYMAGLSSFSRDLSFIDRLFNLDPSRRDVGAARQAFSDFSRLLTLYPNSQYAPDARQRMIHLRNLLAASEINVARYYMRRQAFLAAANRSRYVVENYPNTPSVPDALALMIECYQRIGMQEAANDSLQVLVENFPDHPTLRADGTFEVADPVRNSDRSWVNMVTLGLLNRPKPPPPIRVQQQDEARRTEGEASM